MDAQVVDLIIALSAGLFSILIVVIGWIGSRVHTKLDYLTMIVAQKFDELNKTLVDIERDLRDDLHDIDKRVLKLEGKFDNDK